MPEAISSFQSYQTNDHAPIIVDKESVAEGPSPPTTNIQADNERFVEVVITGVPAEVAVDDITKETGASRAKRLQKRVDGNLQQTSTVVLTYNKDPPTFTYINQQRFRPRPYVRPAIRCYRCQGWNHRQGGCRNRIRCARCGDEHATAQCKLTPDEQLRCANCKGDHS